MTDEVQVPVADTSAPSPETAVVETTVVETPHIETPAESQPVETPPAENTVLGDDVVDPAPVEQAPVEAPVENEGETQSDEPAPELPTYEAFTLPENITVDDELLTEFTKDLADFELKTKADHGAMQELGQKFIDKYISETTKLAQRFGQIQDEVFENKKNKWKEEFENDPVIGGNRRETTITAATQLIRQHGGDAQQQQSLRELFNQTGVGNHPAMIGFLARLNSNMQEGQPLPAQTPPQPKLSKVEKRYGMK